MDNKKVTSKATTAPESPRPIPTTHTTSSSDSGKEQQFGLTTPPVGLTGSLEGQLEWHQVHDANLTTPPPQPRPEQPPPRVRRRTLGRRRRRRLNNSRTGGVPESVTPPNTRRRLQSISQQDNQIQPSNEDTTSLATLPDNLIPNSLVVASSLRPVSNSAVRVLFRDQQQQQRQQVVMSGRRASETSISIDSGRHITGATFANSQHQHREPNRAAFVDRQRSISIAETSRRLIERQLEAMQEADSRRWNFDFRACRPMHQSGHRYVDCSSNLIDDPQTTTNLEHGDELDDNNNN
jgi:hypothetical protein